MQDLWRKEIGWDEEVERGIKENWINFNEDLKHINLISINRWVGTSQSDTLQLHGFCDASEKVYGAVIYSRVRIGDKFRTEIIVSKSRVAPIKVITIPRLELCAADLMTELFKIVIPIFE